MNAAALLQFDGIGKSFAGVPVLREVTFSVLPGRTVGLVGENGAGKSTLMNILGGNLQPDTGRLLFDGRPYAPRSPTEAARQGIAFIHQELNLFTNLSLAENLFITAFPRAGGLPLIARKALRAQASALLAEVGLDLPPDTLVERLSAGERQLVEIAKALSLEARLIIFDEPTTSLSARETKALFALIGRLRARGIALIYISHILDDVLRLSDQIVVLRDGELVGHGPCAQFDRASLIALMVGRNLSQGYPVRGSTPSAEPVLEVEALSQPGVIREISFTLHRGEVLGASGLMGAGRSELARILFGLDPCQRGSIRLNGRSLARQSCGKRIRQGLAFLTENRREEGLCLEASIADNIALVSLRRYSQPPVGLLKLEAIRDAVARMGNAVRLAARAGGEQPVKTLSGGNQQKVVLAKWLLARPDVLILDEPTRGIDVGAKFEVYQLIRELADQGAGILLISSELEELIGLCDRILVLRHGEIKDCLRRDQFDRERILRSALQETTDR